MASHKLWLTAESSRICALMFSSSWKPTQGGTAVSTHTQETIKGALQCPHTHRRQSRGHCSVYTQTGDNQGGTAVSTHTQETIKGALQCPHTHRRQSRGHCSVLTHRGHEGGTAVSSHTGDMKGARGHCSVYVHTHTGDIYPLPPTLNLSLGAFLSQTSSVPPQTD